MQNPPAVELQNDIWYLGHAITCNLNSIKNPMTMKAELLRTKLNENKVR
jgi:hypothetical protein